MNKLPNEFSMLLMDIKRWKFGTEEEKTRKIITFAFIIDLLCYNNDDIIFLFNWIKLIFSPGNNVIKKYLILALKVFFSKIHILEQCQKAHFYENNCNFYDTVSPTNICLIFKIYLLYAFLLIQILISCSINLLTILCSFPK